MVTPELPFNLGLAQQLFDWHIAACMGRSAVFVAIVRAYSMAESTVTYDNIQKPPRCTLPAKHAYCPDSLQTMGHTRMLCWGTQESWSQQYDWWPAAEVGKWDGQPTKCKYYRQLSVRHLTGRMGQHDITAGPVSRTLTSVDLPACSLLECCEILLRWLPLLHFSPR